MIMEKESFKNKKWVLVAAITLTLLVVSVGTTASYAASENSVIANMIPDTTPDTIETVANDGGNGRFKAIANEKQLETLNRLYNTDISFGELVEAAYPEAMEYIPAQALQNMYKTKVIWPNQDTPSSTESTTI